MANETYWTKAKVIELVKQYEQCPVLWDAEHPQFRNKLEKNKKWLQLAAINSSSVTDVRRKMNSLLASYRRETIKLRRKIMTRSSWFAYPHLRSFLIKRKTRFRSDPIAVEPDEREEIYDVLESKPNNITTYYYQDEEEEEEAEPESKIKVIASDHITTSDLGGRAVSQGSNIDECDIFGTYVACKLKKVSPAMRAEIQHEINKIIYKHERRLYGIPEVPTLKGEQNGHDVTSEIEEPEMDIEENALESDDDDEPETKNGI